MYTDCTTAYLTDLRTPNEPLARGDSSVPRSTPTLCAHRMRRGPDLVTHVRRPRAVAPPVLIYAAATSCDRQQHAAGDGQLPARLLSDIAATGGEGQQGAVADGRLPARFRFYVTAAR